MRELGKGRWILPTHFIGNKVLTLLTNVLYGQSLSDMETGYKAFSREVVELLPILFREFARRENNALTRGKISFPQMLTLEVVCRQGRIKMSALASLLAVQMSSATVLADRLVKQGLLERRGDEKDRRVVWMLPTARGRRVIHQILAQKRRSVQAIFGMLGESEREAYLRVLRRVKHRLSAVSKK
jgi:DNA-binding MarR family transcriptional regulator